MMHGDVHKALNQCLALIKDLINVRKGKGKGEMGRGEKKEAQRRADIIREKQSTKCF